MQNLKPFDLVYDRWQDDQPLPNLAQTSTVHQTYGHLRWEWPYITDCGIERWCRQHDFPMKQHRLGDAHAAPGIYAVGISRYDAKTDYFGMMSREVLQYLCQGRLLAAFLVRGHPDILQLQQHFRAGAQKHDLPGNCYRVVVDNAMVAGQIPWFYCWEFAELEYRESNHRHEAIPPDLSPRSRDFTILVRRHQPWRALAMAQFRKSGLLDNAYWSYGNFDVKNAMDWNPLHVNRIPDITQHEIDQFVSHAPYRADDVPIGQQSDNNIMVREHFSDSYLHVILNSSMEAQGGSFLTDKVFKCIKHGQPFVVLGTVNSIIHLHHLGYRTFDKAIQHTYDPITDHNRRYLTFYRLLLDLKTRGLAQVFAECLDDVHHNQRLFMANKQHRLSDLRDQLTFHYLYCNNDYGNFGTYDDIFEPWPQK